MNKEIVQAVIERSKGLCEVCLAPGTEIHHIIFGSGARKQCERIESVILLCYECHRGTYGIHGKNGYELDLQLKKNLEKTYREMDLSEEEIKYWLGGRYYL